MDARVGLVVQEFIALIEELYARHKSLNFNHTLRALEYLRYTITEQALRRGHPDLMRDDPADKKRGGSRAVPPPKDPPPPFPPHQPA